jgi:hypothetical protein
MNHLSAVQLLTEIIRALGSILGSKAHTHDEISQIKNLTSQLSSWHQEQHNYQEKFMAEKLKMKQSEEEKQNATD